MSDLEALMIALGTSEREELANRPQRSGGWQRAGVGRTCAWEVLRSRMGALWERRIAGEGSLFLLLMELLRG